MYNLLNYVLSALQFSVEKRFVHTFYKWKFVRNPCYLSLYCLLAVLCLKRFKFNHILKSTLQKRLYFYLLKVKCGTFLQCPILQLGVSWDQMIKLDLLNVKLCSLGLFVGFILTISSYLFLVCLITFFITSSRATKFRGDRKRKLEDEFKEGQYRMTSKYKHV